VINSEHLCDVRVSHLPIIDLKVWEKCFSFGESP